MVLTEREYANPTLFAHEFQKVVSHCIICFVKVVLLTERGYEYEVSGDVRQSSWMRVFGFEPLPLRERKCMDFFRGGCKSRAQIRKKRNHYGIAIFKFFSHQNHCQRKIQLLKRRIFNYILAASM